MLRHSLLLLAIGCTPDNEVVRQSHSDLFYQEPTDRVDILWVVDNSLSMSDEQAEVADKFGDFIDNIESSGMDFHIGVINTDMDDPVSGRGQMLGDTAYITPDTPDYIAEFQSRVQVGVEGSDREKGIDAAITALTEPLISSTNAGFLREDSTLSIIYVSDENDCTDRGALDGYTEAQTCYDHSDELVPILDLIDEYETLKEGTTDRLLVSAIVGPEISENCDGAVPGFRYHTMAEAFGGLKSSICQSSFASIMEQLGLQVSGELTSFQLSYFAVEDTIEVYIDDDSVPGEIIELDSETWVQVPQSETDGWTYDATYAILYFHGDAIPPRDASIKVDYEVVPGSEFNIDPQ